MNMTKAKTQKFTARHAFIFSVVFCVLVLSIALIWQSSNAAENEITEPKLEIVAANVEYAQSLHLYFGVDATLPEGVRRSDVKIRVFTTIPSDFENEAVAEEAIAAGTAYERGYHKVTELTSGGTTYSNCILFNTQGIAAKNIVDDLYVVAFVEYDGETYYSAPLKYSVLQYVYDRQADLKGKTDADSKAQLNLYDRTLEYGAAAQNVLNYKKDRLATADWKAIKIEGGTLADGFTRGLFLPGDSITVTPEVENTQANPLVLRNAKDEVVGNGLTLAVDANTASGTYRVTTTKTQVAFVGLTEKGGTQSGALLEPGTELVLVANAAPAGGYIRFHWDLAGEINVPNAAPTTATFEYTYKVPASAKEITLSAVYATEEGQIPAADFESAAKLKASDAYFSGIEYSLSKTTYFEIVTIADKNANSNNKAIHMNDNSTETGAGLYFYPSGYGTKTVVEFDFLVANSSSGLTAEMDLGTSYRMELNGQGQVLYLEDRHNPNGTSGEAGLRNDLGVELYYGSWNTFRIEYYPIGSASETLAESMITVLYINGDPVSFSSSRYREIAKNPANLRLWGMQGTTLDCYFDNVKCFRTDDTPDFATNYGANGEKLVADGAFELAIPNATTSWTNRYNALKRLFANGKYDVKETDLAEYTAMWREYYTEEEMSDAEIYKRFQNSIGNVVADSLEYWSMKLFGTENEQGNSVLEWLAGLYDPKTGGYYYSESARDTFGYLPDLESTGQMSGVLGHFGISRGDVFSEEQLDKLGAWVQFLMSNQDGYLYHPQWGTDIGDSRRSRDLNKTSFIDSYSDKNYLYDPALDRLAGVEGTGTANVFDMAESMTARLGTSVATMVSKVVLCAGGSSMPEHLQSTDNLVTYLNNLWGATATTKSIGHSYSFGNTITSQNAQFRAAGPEYMEIVINFLNAKQQEAQEMILADAMMIEKLVGGTRTEDQIDELLRSKDGYMVDGLAAALKYNGVWENGGIYFKAAEVASNNPGYEAYRLYKRAADHKEKLAVSILGADGKTYEGYQIPVHNYNFVSGLLKISGIYNSLGDTDGKKGSELNYAEYALASAIAMMTDDAEHYIKLKESVVSVYNPPNAINNVLSNLNKFGDLTVRNAARQQIQDNALKIVETTMKKISVYQCPDGGFSYGINNSAQASQGEPAAYGNRKEGDVNGTGLSLGARSAMLSALGLANIQILPSYENCTTYDYNGDGVAEETTYAEIFKYAIANTNVATKDDAGVGGYYDYEKGEVPSNTSDEEKNQHSVTIESVAGKDGNTTNALLMKDNESGTGLTVYFDSSAEEANETYYMFQADMKYTTTGDLQLYLSKLKLQISTTSNSIEFQGRTSGDKQQESANTFGTAINPKQWFTMTVKVYPGGTTFTDYMGNTKTVYATVTVTQGNTTVSEGYVNFAEGGWDAASLDAVRFYTTYGSKAGIYLDNVTVKQYGQISDGSYNLDQQKVKDDPGAYGVNGGTIVDDTVTGVGSYLKVDSSASFKAGIVGGAYDFDEVQFSMLIKDASEGATGTVTMKDKADKAIATVRYIISNVDSVNGTATVTFKTYDYTLFTLENVDVNTLVDVKIEMHNNNDGSRRLDVIARYRYVAVDGEDVSYGYDVKAGYVKNFQFVDADATELEFNTAEFTYTGTAGSAVYVDDLFVRLVLLEYHK